MPIRAIISTNTTPPVRPSPPLARARARSPQAPLGDQAETSPPTEPAYTVGYGRPPIATRFQKGRSGNPRGRPKSAKGLKAMVRETMSQKVAVRTATGEKKISRMEAVLHKTIELAMKGNPRALAQLTTLYAAAVPEAETFTSFAAPVEELSATDLAILEELKASWRAEEAYGERTDGEDEQ